MLISIFSVCLCVFKERALIDSPPTPALNSLRSERVLAVAHQAVSLSNTPLIYNLCSPSEQENRWRLEQRVRDALPALLFEENMANTCACSSPGGGWQSFQGSNSSYHSTEAKAPALNQCGGSVMCVCPPHRPMP